MLCVHQDERSRHQNASFNVDIEPLKQQWRKILTHLVVSANQVPKLSPLYNGPPEGIFIIFFK